MYGMRESQFQRFFRLALQQREITGLALLRLLERRLDNVVYRLGWARTRLQARQLVLHRHVLVDGHTVNIPSYLVKPGQVVQLTETARQIPDVVEMMESTQGVPGWLESQNGRGTILREPERNEMDADIAEQRIVEFYSR
jgi:small subunit ribosomal protein S4